MQPFLEVWRNFAEFGYFLKWVWRQFFISIWQPWLKQWCLPEHLKMKVKITT